MNQIESINGNKKENLEKKLEERFNEKELMIARFVLSMKGIMGLSARLSAILEPDNYGNFIFDSGFEKIIDYVVNFKENFRNIRDYQNNLLYDLGRQLNVSEKRIQEIKKFVYSNETSL